MEAVQNLAERSGSESIRRTPEVPSLDSYPGRMGLTCLRLPGLTKLSYGVVVRIWRNGETLRVVCGFVCYGSADKPE